MRENEYPKVIDANSPYLAQVEERGIVDEYLPSISSGDPARTIAYPEVSIVMPCLNEIKTIGICVKKAFAVLNAYHINGEVVVSDNGSTDGSIEMALAAGARVVHQPVRGYGNAYIKGIESAYGRYILMADSDDTYDFNDLPHFLEPLRKGYDVVMGNRFKGTILPGAMTWSHRYIGNPILSGLLNLFFHTGVGDAHCGMRSFTKEAFSRMCLSTGGMEFASEMVINAAKAGLKMTEVPITYYPRQGESKLSSFRDAWRHLRFMLLYSPTHLYLWPGITMLLVGMLALLTLTIGPIQIAGVTFGIHWMFLASLFAILGFQVIYLGFSARVYSLSSEIDVIPDRLVNYFSQTFRLEDGILIGGSLFGIGAMTFLGIVFSVLVKYLDVLQSVRLSIFALTFTIIGVQTIFASFFISMLVVKRRGWF